MQSEPHRDSQRGVCPGLSNQVAWDGVSALRGELYASEHLTSHAAEIARSHGEPSLRSTPGPLRRRFGLARAQLRAAYEILSRDAKNKRDPSPAEEWLLDNSHVVDEQIREIQEDLPWGYLIELPRIASGAMRGYPRVYGLCLDYLRHSDARVDLASLADYVLAYQRVATLTIGELWAVPIMLRLGLTLIVGALAVSEARAKDRELADTWADGLITDAQRPDRLDRTLAELGDEREITAGFLVQLLKRVREHDAPLRPVMDWIHLRCELMGSSPEELTRREHLRQAADQVSVGNAITSMRAIAALDWTRFFELTSEVEAVLRQDPCGAYPEMDQVSRDRCRHAVEQLARRCPLDERGVAERALAQAVAAQAAGRSLAEGHVGYYLLDAGRARLQRELGYRPRLSERFTRQLLAYPLAFYLGALLMLLCGIGLALSGPLWRTFAGNVWLVMATLLLLAIPVSELLLAALNASVVALLPPRLLPKLELKHGIGEEHRTLVVVPTLLETRAGVAQLLDDLEVRSLANPDENLYFALLTDFVDAAEPETAQDRELLERMLEGVRELNQRHSDRPERYFLLHRKRVHNPSAGCYMGWERKRGKLEELNRLLRGATDTTFSVVTAPAELLRSIRYVITLDTDTELPREVARRLIGAMAHPQNRPVLDPTRLRVVRGYGIIQPRVGSLPLSSRRSRFARIFAGPPGIDPYTTAVSDVYQDLCGEGSFVGKGIYDVDAFQAALQARVPDNALLSHDLFEGSFARSALATDIEVLDEQPASYEVVASRQHRWVRGDWQLLPWLLPRVPVRGGGRRVSDLRLLDWWKLFDNLRRSLLAPALVVILLGSWLLDVRQLAPWALGLTAAVFAGPLLVRQVLTLARALTHARSRHGPLGGELWRNVQQLGLGVVLLFDQALLSVDAIVRTLYRLLLSRRQLLEWTTMSQAARKQRRGGARASRRFAASSWLSLLGLLALLGLQHAALPYAAPLLVAWFVAPALLGLLGRPEPARPPDEQLSDADRRRLRLIARKTWRFFDTFVTAKDNWLPPDNYQEDPRGVVAHRTSPTNIGLYLLSIVSARDLGFITAREALARLENTLTTLSLVERRSGHILNWYDTTNLRPLEPQYVSTVDSGNLAAYLWAVRAACEELPEAPLLDAQILEAAQDALGLARQALIREPVQRERREHPLRDLSEVEAHLAEAARDPRQGSLDVLAALERLLSELEHLVRAPWVERANAEARYWLEQAVAVLQRARAQLHDLAPCLELLSVSVIESEALRGGAARARVVKARSPLELAAAASAALAELSEPAATDEAAAAEASSGFSSDLAARLRTTQQACQALHERALAVAADALDLADGMDFSFLYDRERALFAIGYNVSGARLDSSYYDLLASEARLASVVAISKGDAPLEHWWKLARPRTGTSAGRALLSWSGSMFEYLMPLLVTGISRDTLLWETCCSAVGRQLAYAEEQGLPWGISEAAYNVMDLGMTYQYRAFGVPGLGLKSGLGEDLVIAPYATLLASLVRPDLALDNLNQLDREGLDGQYGYYESIDYTPSHVPPGRRSVVVKAFMAHHQGMSLVALGNLLCNWPMRRRFFSDARLKASALLLEERVPTGAPLIMPRAEQVPTPLLGEPELRLTDHVGPGQRALQRLHLLGHGELSTIISASGGGVITWKGMNVTRYREDAALDECGTFIYIRDLTAQTLWSAGQAPTAAAPDYYDASFSIDRVELRRRDGAIETLMEVVVSPEHPAEVRRLTLTNHSEQPCELDVTSYSEPVLASHGADLAHRAFSSMFLETELLPERGAILVRRRPRGEHEAESWMIQVLTPDGDGFGPAELDASREGFLGRAGSLREPRAMRFGHRLGGSAGHTLDPGLSLRRSVRIAGGQRARVTLTTALASSREAALELLDLVVTPHSTARAFELAWADARVELKHLGISAARSHRFQRLLSCLFYAPPALRDASETSLPLTRGRHALWSQGISGDLPILLLRIDHPDFSELCHELLLAHEFWRLNGVSCDLVLLNEEPEGYLQPLQEALLALIRATPAQGRENQHGGVFLRRAARLSPEERRLLLRSARVVLRAAAGSLSQQLRRAAEPVTFPAPAQRTRRPAPRVLASSPPMPDLRHFNGIGGFSADGREYVMNTGPGARPPAPWCNVMANTDFGSVVSETGLGFTWSTNSQRQRLTPWSNDPVLDPSGELLYLRDQEDGEIWSATPAPASLGVDFTVRHGQGYTVYAHTQAEIEHELCVLVAADAPVKLLRLRLRNRGTRKRRLAAYGVVEWVLGAARDMTRCQVSTRFEPEQRTLLANNPFAAVPAAHAFLAVDQPVVSFTADRQELFGYGGSRARPSALARSTLSGRVGVALDPCAALQVLIGLEPGETRELCFALGHGRTAGEALELASEYAAAGRFEQALETLGPVWDGLCAVTAETPDDGFDLLVNRWLPYQITSARLWARSGFYQSGGAYGFRDQLQDVLALLHARPALAREHLLRAAARQFVEGDVQHWWHSENGEGVRTHCSDDMLWLPYATAAYVRVTGDRQILDQHVPFLEERALAADEADLFSVPRPSTESATLYEHCLRALARGMTSGAHGLPLMLGGDWNDGMNRVGVHGKGESVWLAWFLVRALEDFAPLARARGDLHRADVYAAQSAGLRRAVEEHAWDGAWYRRAFYDDGTPIGSRHNQDCRIDAIAQSWAVIAGGDSARARQAVESSEAALVWEDERIVLLLDPPFADASHDPGYIRSYPPGIRENGGQYTHGVLWTVQALCLLGEGTRAHKLFSMLNPITHATDPAGVKRYRVEPYVLAADVYSSPEHAGRGGWTWYTGSASWMYRIAIENMLGLQRHGDTLHIAPCVPSEWREFRVSYRYGTSELSLIFENPEGVTTGVRRIELDSRELARDSVPLLDDGRQHRVRVVMGSAGDGAGRLPHATADAHAQGPH